MSRKTAVCGAGGFIGGHLVKALLDEGQEVVAVDLKPQLEWFQVHAEAQNHYTTDLRSLSACTHVVRECDTVYNLAADMGGMGFIETHKAECMQSVLINTHLLMAARDAGVEKYFYASSACVYAADKQTDTKVTALKESDAYPAMPEDGYGWEKLFSERMCRHFHEDYNLGIRIARFHNVYGPHTSYDGGREKAPAAICRKVIEAKLSGKHEIEIWGDGEQTRSFMYIDDCITGIDKMMRSSFVDPLNLGSAELISVNNLVTMVEGIANISLKRKYDLTAPQGVRGRNSDNTLIQKLFNWEPSTPLLNGMEAMYRWIFNEMTAQLVH